MVQLWFGSRVDFIILINFCGYIMSKSKQTMSVHNFLTSLHIIEANNNADHMMRTAVTLGYVHRIDTPDKSI